MAGEIRPSCKSNAFPWHPHWTAPHRKTLGKQMDDRWDSLGYWGPHKWGEYPKCWPVRPQNAGCHWIVAIVAPCKAVKDSKCSVAQEANPFAMWPWCILQGLQQSRCLAACGHCGMGVAHGCMVKLHRPGWLEPWQPWLVSGTSPG